MVFTFKEAQKNVEKLKTILKILDFSDEEIEKQTKDLGEIVVTAIWKRLMQEKALAVEGKSPEELQELLKNNFSKEELQKISTEEAEKMLAGYIGAVTKNASDEQLAAIDKVLATS